MAADFERFEISETDALATAAKYEGPLIIDLDETLYLQNSTADFLDCAAPSFLAIIIMKALDLFSPWRWTGGRITRDLWRVRVVIACFPGARSRWLRRCQAEGQLMINLPLLRAIRAHPRRFIIATSGFTSIVQPLLSAMGCSDAELVACRLSHPSDRSRGKAYLIDATLGTSLLQEAMVITDSYDDIDVLRRCGRPCLTRWRDAKFRRPFQSGYFPGSYTVFVKRPAVGAAKSTVTTLLFWLVVVVVESKLTMTTLPAVFLLFWSFWAVYETGYLDNDRCALKFEVDPVVTQEFIDSKHLNLELKAWVWAVALGVLGIFLLDYPKLSILQQFKWILLLLVTRLVFHVYNRIDKKTRVWLYLVLQLLREGGFLLVIHIEIVGILLVFAQIMSRWYQYIIYRSTGTAETAIWPSTHHRAFRLVVFTILLNALAYASHDPESYYSLPSLALVLFGIALALKDLLTIFRQAHRIDRNIIER